MTSNKIIQLSLHILFGLAGVGFLYAYLTNILKKTSSLAFLRRSALWATAMLVASWVSGGMYYLGYYGSSVRDVIRKGNFAWAHGIFMEGKEHMYIFLPFLAIVLYIVTWSMEERVNQSLDLKKALTLLASVAFGLGVIITLSGVVISGGFR